MYSVKSMAYFRCTKCHAMMPIHVSLRDYDASQYTCEVCGADLWVPLDELRDSKGQRLISHRPFDDPQAEQE